MTKQLLPTHSCFDDALELLERMILEEPQLAHSDDLVLVHAICLMPGDGHEFAHAWLETKDGSAYFAAVWHGRREFVRAPAVQYRKALRVVEETRYTSRQAWENNRLFGHYGPWIPAYRSLCKNVSKNGGLNDERIRLPSDPEQDSGAARQGAAGA